MRQTRRNFLMTVGAGTLAACVADTERAPESAFSNPFVINGNMVLSPEFEKPLTNQLKAQLKETGLTAVKISLGGSAGTYALANEHIAYIDGMVETNSDALMQVRSYADLKEAKDTGRVGLIYSFEAATMLEETPARITEFAQRGVRIMQPGYNNSNAFGAGVMSVKAPLGLTDLGREAITAMENAKVLVDLSHAHEVTATDILVMASRPVGMTHTGCDAIHSHQRNKSDAVLRATAESGGVVGIYEMSYLTPDLEQQSLEAFLAHITHALNVCGEEHVGIGSDTPILGFDTGPESMKMWNEINAHRKETGVAAPGEGPPPYVVGLNGPGKMTDLGRELGKRGHKSSVVDKILGDNFARLFKLAWA